MTISPVTIGGFTGAEKDTVSEFVDRIARRWVAAGNPLPNTPPELRSPEEKAQMIAFSREMTNDIDRHCLARWHNGLVPLVAAEQAAQEAAHRAAADVTTRWEELATAPHWHAAHHRYALAVHAARQAIQAWIDAAAERDQRQREVDHQPPWGQNPPQGWAWEEYLRSVPEHERIPPTGSDDARLALFQLNEQHRERQAIADETLRRPDGDL
jgi:hypothetical protein